MSYRGSSSEPIGITNRLRLVGVAMIKCKNCDGRGVIRDGVLFRSEVCDWCYGSGDTTEINDWRLMTDRIHKRPDAFRQNEHAQHLYEIDRSENG